MESLPMGLEKPNASDVPDCFRSPGSRESRCDARRASVRSAAARRKLDARQCNAAERRSGALVDQATRHAGGGQHRGDGRLVLTALRRPAIARALTALPGLLLADIGLTQ